MLDKYVKHRQLSSAHAERWARRNTSVIPGSRFRERLCLKPDSEMTQGVKVSAAMPDDDLSEFQS